MKRIIIFFCLTVLISNTSKAQTDNAGWMASLPDTTHVCRLSIPGTHDSGTSGVRFPMRHYARTQTMDLSGQWDAGIRFFDLRPRLDGGELKIYHGPASCHLTLADALSVLMRKIEDNPTEFCIVMTNSAGGGQITVDVTMEEISSVVPAGMLADFKAYMTVSDIRGKILFIHRNAPSDGADLPGAVVRGWPGNGSSRRVRLQSSAGTGAVLWAQDYFTSGSNDADAYLQGKWDSMYRLLQAFGDAADGVWCINHASGYTGTGVRTNIGKNTRNTNARLLDWLNENRQPVGIIPMDFPSQELIDAIIECNR